MRMFLMRKPAPSAEGGSSAGSSSLIAGEPGSWQRAPPSTPFEARPLTWPFSSSWSACSVATRVRVFYE